MLSKKLEAALNQQITKENYASHYYLSMASWCSNAGLKGSSRFLYAHAEQERDHMMRLFHYVNDSGGYAKVESVKQPEVDFKDLGNLFKLVLKHERTITKDINELVDLCLAEKDHSSFNFLQWYVAEQHEEENLFNDILDLIKITGLEGSGLFMLDKEIGSMASVPAQKPVAEPNA